MIQRLELTEAMKRIGVIYATQEIFRDIRIAATFIQTNWSGYERYLLKELEQDYKDWVKTQSEVSSYEDYFSNDCDKAESYRRAQNENLRRRNLLRKYSNIAKWGPSIEGVGDKVYGIVVMQRGEVYRLLSRGVLAQLAYWTPPTEDDKDGGGFKEKQLIEQQVRVIGEQRRQLFQDARLHLTRLPKAIRANIPSQPSLSPKWVMVKYV